MTKPKLELETWCGASFKAWNDAAREAGLVLRQPQGVDSGDYPNKVYSGLRRVRRILATGKNVQKVVTHMHRQLVSERDDKGRPVKREYLTYSGEFRTTDHRNIPYSSPFEIGKYDKPKVVTNPGRKYDPDTGLPKGQEFIFSGSQTVYTIPVPDKKEARKKLIDSIIGEDNFTEDIKYYFDNEGEPMGRSDPTYSYDDFCNYSIEELKNISYKGGGSLTPGIYRDNDGKLRDRDGNLIQQ